MPALVCGKRRSELTEGKSIASPPDPPLCCFRRSPLLAEQGFAAPPRALGSPALACSNKGNVTGLPGGKRSERHVDDAYTNVLMVCGWRFSDRNAVRNFMHCGTCPVRGQTSEVPSRADQGGTGDAHRPSRNNYWFESVPLSAPEPAYCNFWKS